MSSPFVTGRLLTVPLAVVAAVAVSAPAHAEQYLSVAAAQQLMFPGQALTPVTLALTSEQRAEIARRAALTAAAVTTPQAWRAADGGWLLVDGVIGKHDRIDYAVALDAEGKVRQVEVLEYRELYGAEIRNRRWRAQFTGKQAGDAVQIGEDIQSISGATLSCQHVTDGIRRLLTLHAVVLKSLG